MTGKKLSRRDFLRMSALTATGAALAGCAPKVVKETVIVEKPVEKIVQETVIVAGTPQVVEKVVTATPEPPPAPKPAKGHVFASIPPSDFPDELLPAFLAEHPGITVEVGKVSYTRLYAMIAAGTPPDIIRASMNRLPLWVARDILMDLTEAYHNSTAIDVDDLWDVNKGYWFDGAMHGGTGKIYGMVQDWSNDFGMWLNKELVTNGGLEVPDEVPPLHFAQIREIAENSAVFDGDRIDVWGAWIGRALFIVPNILSTMGMTLFKDDMTKIDLTGNEVTTAMLRWLYDLAKDRLMTSVVHPMAGSRRTAMSQGKIAIANDGYWFGQQAESELTEGKLMFLPAPTWEKDGPRQANCAYGVGGCISVDTKVFDAAWEVYEWYYAGAPALQRAETGWGVPATKSMMPLLPNEKPLDQQRLRVLKDDLQYLGSGFEYSPFLSASALIDNWNLYLEEALRGTITFDEMVATIEKAVNTEIEKNITALY